MTRRLSWAGNLSIVLLLGAMLAACGEGSDKVKTRPPTLVSTAKGTVSGKSTAAMREYLGIPYAAPPVENLRWKPPQPARPWTGVRPAKAFAPHCPQTDSPFGQPSTTEDCLYLNVFTPKDGGRHPVMVWFHGGAFIDGESDDYNPIALVKKGIVVVTVNYRLGILGFLADTALSAESPNNQSGDYGLMDQQAALRWVQRNIANFGGNKNKVTIFGVSAGGLSVFSQVVSPTAKGLFQRAIVESGSYSLVPPLRNVTLKFAEGFGKRFDQKVGCTQENPQQKLECLRKLPVKKILGSQSSSPLRFVPNIRTQLLPRSILQALNSGQFTKVPMIEGTNRNEWRLFVALEHDLTPAGPLKPADYPSAIQSTFLVSKADAQKITQQYPLGDYPSADVALAAVGTASVFACNGRTEIRKLSQYTPTYAYEFNDPNAPEIFLPTKPVTYPFKSAHSSEIQYLFDFFDAKNILANPSNLTPKQKKLSNKMVDYWTHFARTGNPNPPSGAIAAWPQYQEDQTYLSLTPPSPHTFATFVREHKCGFWDNLLGP